MLYLISNYSGQRRQLAASKHKRDTKLLSEPLHYFTKDKAIELIGTFLRISFC